MRYDIEFVVATLAKDYLDANLDASQFANCPAIEFYDPMAVDDSSRVVCLVNSADSDMAEVGNFEVRLDVGVRTKWDQPTVATDLATHKLRLAAVRDVLCAPRTTMVEALAALCPVGFTVYGINNQRSYATEVNDGSYYSTISLTLRCIAIED